MHSTTKYCGGHSDIIGGALVLNDDALAEQLRFHQNAIGGVASPFDCWLVLRGLRTLAGGWNATATTPSWWRPSWTIIRGSPRSISRG